MTDRLTRMTTQLGRRYRQAQSLWRADGPAGIIRLARRGTSEWLSPKDAVMPVRRADVMAADLSRRPWPAAMPAVPGQPLTANWVMTPPAAGSGGHTTIFRLIRYLEAHGYRNRVYFYDVYGGDHRYYEAIVRSYYNFYGPVGNVDDGMVDAHSIVATGWPTAYAAFTSSCAGKRFYFVQDYEPSFHPAGALCLLAENTYRMGFHGITAGRWLAGKLSTEFPMQAEPFDFGCDTGVYRRIPGSQRSGLVFYARPEATRRGFELGLMAMEIFARRHPEIDLHFYGGAIGDLPFRFINHGRIGPGQLNTIYNQCQAGLSLSLTNVSLVPHEMLAAGCIPVVNDALHNRIVLNNSFVRYADPYPQALVEALEAVVFNRDFDALSQAAALSVRGTSWDDAGATVDGIIRRALRMDAETNLRHETTGISFEDELVPGIEVRV